MRRILCLLALIALAAVWAWPQNSRAIVEVRPVLAADGAHPDSTIKAAVVAQIATGFHINDHKPTLDYLIPTELEFQSHRQVSTLKVVYPPGKLKPFTFSERPLSVYEGAFTVGARLKISPTASPGIYTLRGKLKYQACNDHACSPPASVPVTFSLKVVSPRTPLKRLNGEIFNGVQLN